MGTIGQDRRLFDLDSARRTLPLVSRVLSDIVRAHREIADLHVRASDLLSAGDRSGAEALQDRMQELASEQSDYVAELDRIGCELKGPIVGLVDFPTRLGGRIVYLCYKLGEETIDHWHEIHAGFAGRHPTEGLEFSSEPAADD